MIIKNTWILLFITSTTAFCQDVPRGATVALEPEAMKGKVYALVVGVSDYKNEMFNDLKYAAADARAIAEYLRTGPLRLEKLIELYDKDATRGAVKEKGLNAIDELVFGHRVKPEDLILIYLSGHGGAFTKDNSFFFPYDAAHATDAGTSFSIKRIKGTIRDWATESKATVIFVFDACRSATLAKGQPEIDLSEVGRFLEEDTGEILLAASQGGEPALEKSELRHGVFSFCLLEALYGKADKNKDDWISVFELKAYLDINVADRTNDSQQPMIKYPGGFQRKLVAPVNRDLLAKADEKLKLDLSNASVIQLAAKGAGDTDKAKQLSDLIGNFQEALKKGELIEPENSCAYYFYQQMIKMVPDASFSDQLSDLKMALYDRALNTLNSDINGERHYMKNDGKDKTTYNLRYYSLAGQCLDLYIKLNKRNIEPGMYALRDYLKGRDLNVQFMSSNFKKMELIKQSVKSLKTAVEKYPDQAYLWQGLAMAYLDDPRAEYTHAIEAANQAKKLAPFWSYPIITLAECAYGQGEADKAEKLLEEALKLNQQDFYSFYMAGNTLQDGGKSEQAIDHYKKSIALNPLYVDAHINLGYSLAELGKNEEAIEHYKKAIELDPTNSSSYYNLGVVLSDLGQKEAAIEYYKKAIELDPLDAHAHYNVGNTLFDLGQKEAAIEQYKKAIELDPTDSKAYNNLGNTLFDLGQKEAAIEHFKKAIELNPLDADVFYNLGIVLSDLGQKEAAIEHYKKAIELDTTKSMAYYNLGSALSDLGQKEAAIEHLKKAIELDPEDGWVSYDLANIYQQLNQVLNAEQYFKLALSKANDDLSLQAWCFFRMKDLQKGEELFKQAIQERPDDAGGYYDYACFFSLTNQSIKALEQLEIAFTKGFKDWAYLQSDEDLTSLKELSEFKELVKKYNDKSAK